MNDITVRKENGITLNIQVQPGAGKNEISGVYNGRLKVRLAAKAVDGAANEALLRYLSDSLGVTRSSISLLKGHKSRQKVVFIEGDPNRLAKSIQSFLN